uniref:BTB domain-containing protein n=1 Tax=Macrostomum lignano TaxID=282301 RepID=A0A1I8HEV5_9PLAT
PAKLAAAGFRRVNLSGTRVTAAGLRNHVPLRWAAALRSLKRPRIWRSSGRYAQPKPQSGGSSYHSCASESASSLADSDVADDSEADNFEDAKDDEDQLIDCADEAEDEYSDEEDSGSDDEEPDAEQGLAELDLAFCTAWSSARESLLQLCALRGRCLRSLSLASSDGLTEADLAAVCSLCPGLVWLDLRCCRLQLAGIAEPLCRLLNQLHSLHLDGWEELADEQAGQLFASLMRLTRLRCLSLNWCPRLTPQACRAIGSELLELRHFACRCNLADGTDLEAVISGCRKLESVDLSFIKGSRLVTDRLMFSVAANLQQLVKLDVSFNPFVTDRGVSSVLAACPSLQEADFSGLKQITSRPFLPIIHDLPSWRRTLALLRLRLAERAARWRRRASVAAAACGGAGGERSPDGNSSYVGNDNDDSDDDGESSGGDEDFEELELPRRSRVFAPALRILRLLVSDLINEDCMREIVAVCRGSLVVYGYSADPLEPRWVTIHPGRQRVLESALLSADYCQVAFRRSETMTSCPLPPQFPNSHLNIPPFLRSHHPYTKWMINMIRGRSHHRLTTMVRERPELFQQIFQIADQPDLIGNDSRDSQSMFHRNAVLYLNPLSLAIYLKEEKSVEIILRSGVNHGHQKSFATDVFSRGVAGGDIVEILPVCVAIRREFYEAISSLSSVAPPFMKDGQALTLDISRPFELHYESKASQKVFKYRDTLHYGTETMKTRLNINISSLLESLITIRPEIWQPQVLDDDGFGQKISLFRRIARVAYYEDPECRKSHNLISALETLFKNRCFLELQPTPDTKAGFVARIQSLDPMIMDQDCAIALLMGLYYRMHCKVKNGPMNSLADIIRRALTATKWRKTFLRLPVEHLQKIFSCLPENVALPTDSLLAIKTHISIINEKEQDSTINLTGAGRVPASELRSVGDDCALLRVRQNGSRFERELVKHMYSSSAGRQQQQFAPGDMGDVRLQGGKPAGRAGLQQQQQQQQQLFDAFDALDGIGGASAQRSGVHAAEQDLRTANPRGSFATVWPLGQRIGFAQVALGANHQHWRSVSAKAALVQPATEIELSLPVSEVVHQQDAVYTVVEHTAAVLVHRIAADVPELQEEQPLSLAGWIGQLAVIGQQVYKRGLANAGVAKHQNFHTERVFLCRRFQSPDRLHADLFNQGGHQSRLFNKTRVLINGQQPGPLLIRLSWRRRYEQMIRVQWRHIYPAQVGRRRGAQLATLQGGLLVSGNQPTMPQNKLVKLGPPASVIKPFRMLRLIKLSAALAAPVTVGPAGRLGRQGGGGQARAIGQGQFSEAGLAAGVAHRGVRPGLAGCSGTRLRPGGRSTLGAGRERPYSEAAGPAAAPVSVAEEALAQGALESAILGRAGRVGPAVWEGLPAALAQQVGLVVRAAGGRLPSEIVQMGTAVHRRRARAGSSQRRQRLLRVGRLVARALAADVPQMRWGRQPMQLIGRVRPCEPEQLVHSKVGDSGIAVVIAVFIFFVGFVLISWRLSDHREGLLPADVVETPPPANQSQTGFALLQLLSWAPPFRMRSQFRLASIGSPEAEDEAEADADAAAASAETVGTLLTVLGSAANIIAG